MCFPALAVALPSLFGTAAAGAGVATAGTGLALGGVSAATGITAATTAASTAAAGMTAMQGISLAASVAGTGLSAISAMNAASMQQGIARNNAATAAEQAKSILASGERDAQTVQRRGSQMEGAQRARMAANGLDITSGTPADLIDQTDFFTAQDVATTRNNAKKGAWNAQAQAAGYSAQANGYSPLTAGATSLLGGAGQVADKWYQYNRPSPPALSFTS